MSRHRSGHRSGFIIVEALIALTIICVVFIALEGSLTIVVRNLADSERESIAVELTETRRENILGTGCSAASGADSSNTVVADWTASVDAGFVHIAQSTRYPRRGGERTEDYDVLARCQ
jgi:Tfp pilus assembly protein PilV